jgi:hypothetical protein
MKFCYVGGRQASLSPFTEETKRSFFVRQVNGHWLFKDFSSGYGGSFIDFVLLKEGFSKVEEAMEYIRKLIGGSKQRCQNEERISKRVTLGYDIKNILKKISSNDYTICQKYLARRGISEEVIDNLADKGILFHNQYRDHSYCCFAVFDLNGGLCCLDNHQIDGEGKFVIGKKDIFTYDWQILPKAKHVFVCEGVIDYLSIKTLEGDSSVGIALLGNAVRFNTELIKSAQVITLALDGDEGGYKAVLDLQEKFSDKEFSVYDIGQCKDPNEYLQEVKDGKDPTNLTPQEKLKLYKESITAANKKDVAIKWGINRSYMYEIKKDCEEIIVNGFSQRNRGRKSAQAPRTLSEAQKIIARLEEEKRQEAIEKERYYARSEFLKLRLKWAENDVSELRGKRPQNNNKKQIKKKKKRIL